jgi:hypothetical protein
MTCAELQEVLPEVLEGSGSAEQEAHLKSCSICSGLVADLELISRKARELQELNEPSPRVWNSIEIALRREGLIREPQTGPLLVPPVRRSWSRLWLAPVAVAAVLVVGILVNQKAQRDTRPMAQTPVTRPVRLANQQSAKSPASVSNEDQQLLEAVAWRSPAVRAEYATNLGQVNAYIRDAEETAQADPNDEEAQQVVMDAYEQRAAVYEMAWDRSLP